LTFYSGWIYNIKYTYKANRRRGDKTNYAHTESEAQAESFAANGLGKWAPEGGSNGLCPIIPSRLSALTIRNAAAFR